MRETVLLLILSVVMYVAGRYDIMKEIESGTWDLDLKPNGDKFCATLTRRKG